MFNADLINAFLLKLILMNFALAINFKIPNFQFNIAKTFQLLAVFCVTTDWGLDADGWWTILQLAGGLTSPNDTKHQIQKEDQNVHQRFFSLTKPDAMV